MRSAKEFRDYLPLMAVKDDCIVSKRGDMTFGWRLTLPTAFTVNEAGYDSIIHTFLQAYKNLPAWCIVHKQDVFCFEEFHAGKSGFVLADEYGAHFDGRRFLNGHSYVYLTFSKEDIIQRKSADSGFFGFMDRRSLPSPEEIRSRADAASTFEHILRSNELLGVKALSSEDLLSMGANGRDSGVIADYLRAYDLGGCDYNFDFYDDHVQYGDRQLKVWYLEDSDSYPGTVSSVQAVTSMSTGATKVFLSGGSPIGYSLRVPHVVNRYIVTVPKGVVEKELDMRKRVDVSFSNYGGAENAVNASELEAYLQDSANNNTITVKCFTDLMAWPTRDELPAVRNAVVTAFRSELDMSVVEDTMNVPLLHYAGIPGAAAELGYENYMNSEILGFLCHGLWDGYDFGMNDGAIHVCDRTCMTPIKIDLQSKAQVMGLLSNTNALVAGPSGSGKSFTMNSLVQDFYGDGQHIMIVDVGDSYEGICSIVREISGGVDGVYNTYDPEHPFSFNPFKGRSEWNNVDSEGESTSNGLNYIFSIFQTMYVPKTGWDETASSVLNFLLMQFFEWWDGDVPEWVSDTLRDIFLTEAKQRAEKNGKKFVRKSAVAAWRNPVRDIFPEGRRGKDPIFDDFYQYISWIVVPLVNDGSLKMGNIPVTKDKLNVEDFGTAMDMYKKDGLYGFLLNAEEEADLFKSRLTVFEVDMIKDNKQLFPLWVLCIMHSFEAKMRALRCQKVMIIEEAWKAIATDTMAEFIKWMWRTARKFSTSAYVVTQDINDLIGSPIIQNAIINNSDVRILLDQRGNANNFDNAVRVLGLSPMATNLVLSVNTNLQSGYHYKEGYFEIGKNYSNVFAIEVSEFQAVAFETDKVKKAPVFMLEKKYGSYIAAVREVLRRGGVKYLNDVKDKKVVFIP